MENLTTEGQVISFITRLIGVASPIGYGTRSPRPSWNHQLDSLGETIVGTYSPDRNKVFHQWLSH